MTYAGSLGLCLFAFVVFLGTSMPFITKLIGNSTNVAISYYNSSGLLAVVFILISLLLAVVYPWVRPARAAGAGAVGSNDAVAVNADEMDVEAASVEAAAVEVAVVEAAAVEAEDVPDTETTAVTVDAEADKTKAPMAPAVTKIGVALAGAVLFAAAGLIVGIHQSMFMTMMVLLGLFAAGAVFAISILAFGKGFGRGMSKAALVTHIGLTLLVAGVLFSSAGAEKESPVSFKAGEQKTVLGRQITFIGTEELTDNPGYLQKFEVNGEPVEIASRYHGERFGYERKPAILWSLLGDYYVAPDVAGAVQTLSFGVPKRIDVEGERIELTLKDFGMASEDADDPSVFVLLDVVQGDKHVEVNLQLLRSAESEMYDTEQVPVFDKYNIFLESISPTNMTVSVYVYGINETLAEAVNKVNLEVSTKPLIVLVWLGTIVVSLGIIWAALRRWGPSPFQDLHNRKRKKEAIM
jgi:cytochrome c biogenesis factor